MYRLNSFQDGLAHVVHTNREYDAYWKAPDEVAADALVVGLNIPEMLAELEAFRFSFEVAGLDLGDGVTIKTDRESQGQIGDAFASLKSGLIPDVDFKTATGWVVLDLSQITSIARATAAHSRGCFRGERAVATAIESATTMVEIEAINISELFRAAYSAAYSEVMSSAVA